MQIPVQITFRNMEKSEALETKIREKVDELEQFARDMVSCRITVEAPHKHHNKGNLYAIKVDVTLPGDEIVVSRSPGQNHAHEDVYVATRDAFAAMRRQLEDYVRKRRHKVKAHEILPHGIISVIYPEKGYGFILTPEQREVYFHRNSVLNADFDSLEQGESVHFSEELGDEGPQATAVHVEGKHHEVAK
ncbi:HPF/RaiA family ribosome-associated protein [Sulfuriflexus sp.]|uniref:HPF/RaiA family ribosome-associated protein n=1 Tax=Sulfuriflexus sp. TaxID=2015443 RepID=UPI0028CC70E3|nr:HPF/RaiA family ribosome-associated protein [Sulfuriflexus sp.]MDT8403746.1 HPF/RaiA family ribosome-associated protein [Sulfuriflexus sp.]